MDNEQTRLINPAQPEAPKADANVYPASNDADKTASKNKKGTILAGVAAGGAIGAAGAAGAALGAAGAALYATHNMEEEAVAAVEAAQDHGKTVVEHETVIHHVNEPAHHHHHQAHHAQPAHHQQPAHHAQPEPLAAGEEGGMEGMEPIDVSLDDANNFDDGLIMAANFDDNTDSDSEVRILGIETYDNGEGGEALVGLLQHEANGELAAVVDIESDGTIDVIAIDENFNQHFEDNEIYDVSDMNISTEDVFADAIPGPAYAPQASGAANFDESYDDSYVAEASYEPSYDEPAYQETAYEEPTYEEPSYEPSYEESYAAADDYSADADPGF